MKPRVHFFQYIEILEFECDRLGPFPYYSKQRSRAAWRFLQHNCRTRELISRKRSAENFIDDAFPDILRQRQVAFQRERDRQRQWQAPSYSTADLVALGESSPRTACVLCECLGYCCHMCDNLHMWGAVARGKSSLSTCCPSAS